MNRKLYLVIIIISAILISGCSSKTNKNSKNLEKNLELKIQSVEQTQVIFKPVISKGAATGLSIKSISPERGQKYVFIRLKLNNTADKPEEVPRNFKIFHREGSSSSLKELPVSKTSIKSFETVSKGVLTGWIGFKTPLRIEKGVLNFEYENSSFNRSLKIKNGLKSFKNLMPGEKITVSADTNTKYIIKLKEYKVKDKSISTTLKYTNPGGETLLLPGKNSMTLTEAGKPPGDLTPDNIRSPIQLQKGETITKTFKFSKPKNTVDYELYIDLTVSQDQFLGSWLLS